MVRSENENAKDVSKLTLRDSLPVFLDHLADAIKQQELAGPVRSSLLRIACEHAEDRKEKTMCTVEEVIREYEILRKVIFEVLEEDELLIKSARETILDAVTSGMTEASAQISDISAKREQQIAEQLKEAEYLFKAIFDHAASGKALIDVNTGKYIKVNRRFCELHGYTEDELTRMHLNDLTYKEDQDKQAALFESKVKERSRGWTLEKRNVAKDGRLIWVLASSAILYQRDGTPKEIVTTLVDISEMKKTEEELRESEEYNRRIIESSEDCFKIIALDGTLLELAESSKRHLEIEEESGVIGSNWINFWKRSDDYEAAKKGVKEAVEKGHGHFIGHYRTPSGSREWWDVIISPIRDREGKPEKLLVVSRDVTVLRNAEIKLRESEEKFRGFAEAMPQKAFIADADGKITYYNDRHYKYFGVNPGETEGWAWTEKSLHHPDDLERTIKQWKHCVATGEPYEIEYRLRRHDGEYRWHLGRAMPQRDSSGKIIRWFGTNTDIQEQKKLIESLHAEKDLRERFVNTLTHDLRTPLSVIRMSAQILEAETIDPEASDVIKRILRNVSLSDQMIRDLLDTNRIRAGRGLSVKINNCIMSEAIRLTVKNLEVVYGKRFQLNTEGACDGFWDPDAIRRIAENLITNAIKYGDQKSPVRIEVKDLGRTVQLQVHNKGSAIPPEEQKNLFDQFSRARSAESGGQKGWGIGLTIVKGLAVAHCAEVSVASSAAEGTTFTVTFPRDSRPCLEARLKGQEAAN